MSESVSTINTEYHQSKNRTNGMTNVRIRWKTYELDKNHTNKRATGRENDADVMANSTHWHDTWHNITSREYQIPWVTFCVSYVSRRIEEASSFGIGGLYAEDWEARGSRERENEKPISHTQAGQKMTIGKHPVN